MKFNRTPVYWGVFFGALLLATTCSHALILGPVRGAALLGKPLDLAVLVQYASEEEASPACFEADVHYGETPMERSRIAVNVLPGSQPNSQWVHVTSSATVDEALVRLTLRAVCNPKASRQYTVLSDVVSDLAGASVVTRAITPAAKTASNTSPAVTAVSGGASTPVKPAGPTVKQSPPPKERPAQKVAQPAMANSADLEDLQRRVDEIAKWQSTSSSAEDLLKSEARTKALEADIRGLQQVTAKNQQNIQLVASAVESNSAQSYERPLAYGLGALLLACIAALAFTAKRMRSGSLVAAPWWSGEPERAQSQGTSVPVQATPTSQTNSTPAALGPTSVQGTLPGTLPAALDVLAGSTGMDTELKESVAAALAPPDESQPGVAARPVLPDFAPSAPGNMKSINTREMLDVRQQAEFFMALGQHDEAVRLLESSIQGSADSNPLVFLDLLKIFHTLSRRTDFERYRTEFNAQFTGRISPYSNFLSEGNSLDAYEDICNQIVVLWPTEYTVDYIEQCLVRLPEDDPEQGMDLEAFRDLLMLHGVLMRLDQGYDSNLAPFSASRSDPSLNAPLAPVMTAPSPVMPTAAYGAVTVAMDIDLDLDLNLDDVGLPELASPQDNLIDFDMSEYIAQKKSGSNS